MAYAQLRDQAQGREWLDRAIAGKDRDYAGHAELGRFCDEARSLLGVASEERRPRPVSARAFAGASNGREESRMKLLVVVVSYKVTDLTIDCLRR